MITLRQYRPLNLWQNHTSLHGPTTQKTAIFTAHNLSVSLRDSETIKETKFYVASTHNSRTAGPILIKCYAKCSCLFAPIGLRFDQKKKWTENLMVNYSKIARNVRKTCQYLSVIWNHWQTALTNTFLLCHQKSMTGLGSLPLGSHKIHYVYKRKSNLMNYSAIVIWQWNSMNFHLMYFGFQ
jgi:hypothetical protein